MADAELRLASAIARQHAPLREALAAGMPRLGWKICVNDRASRGRLGLAAPFVGWLDGARRFASGEACPLPAGGVFAVEPEIAIRVVAPLAPASDLAAARAAIGAVAPVLGPDVPRLLLDGASSGAGDASFVPSDRAEVVLLVARSSRGPATSAASRGTGSSPAPARAPCASARNGR